MARKRSGKKSCLSSILTGIVALGIIGALFGGGGDTKETAEKPKDPPKETVEEVIPPEVVEETPEDSDPEPEQPEEPEPETPAAEPAKTETPAPAQTEPAAEPETPAQTEQPEQAAPKSRTVYVTATGKCYHYDRHCNGGTYFESDLDSAQRQGLKPCKKCVG